MKEPKNSPTLIKYTLIVAFVVFIGVLAWQAVLISQVPILLTDPSGEAILPQREASTTPATSTTPLIKP